MTKSLELSKKISKQLDKDNFELLENVNLHKIFEPIFNLQLGYDLTTCNTIICYCILAYDPNSLWIELSSDRTDDKAKILKGLNADASKLPYSEIIQQNVEEVNNVIYEYLKVACSWKWKAIMTSLDVFQSALQSVNAPIATTDALEIEKIKKERYTNLKLAYQNRDIADNLLKEIQSEFVKTDKATRLDYGFETTSEVTIDPMSWRQFILHTVIPAKENK